MSCGSAALRAGLSLLLIRALRPCALRAASLFYVLRPCALRAASFLLCDQLRPGS